MQEHAGEQFWSHGNFAAVGVSRLGTRFFENVHRTCTKRPGKARGGRGAVQKPAFFIEKSGAPGETRTPALLVRSEVVQNSKCRCWCRLQRNAPFISLLSWTEVGLKWLG
jgi:hypothetical protein